MYCFGNISSCKIFLQYLKSIHCYMLVSNLQQNGEGFGHENKSVVLAIVKAL